MASMRDIKRRRGSIQSTQQITKAMKLVSTVKLQHAKTTAENSRFYFRTMYDTITAILRKSAGIEHPYLKASAGGKKCVIAITSNRGLAGGYNSNVIKLVTRGGFSQEDTVIYAIGRKGRDALANAGFNIIAENQVISEAPVYKDAQEITKAVLAAFEEGRISELYLAYTAFKNTVTHVPTLLRLLPVDTDAVDVENDEAMGDKEDTYGSGLEMTFEPQEQAALDLLIPKYVTSLIFGALVESVASENGARMQAMDSATNNATDMIEDLTLLYNRARQSSITQELTEIIAGADAIS